MISGFEKTFHNPSGLITIKKKKKTHSTKKIIYWSCESYIRKVIFFWVWGKMGRGLLGVQYVFSLLAGPLVQLWAQKKPSDVDLIRGIFPLVRAMRDHFGHHLGRALLPSSDLYCWDPNRFLNSYLSEWIRKMPGFSRSILRLGDYSLQALPSGRPWSSDMNSNE